MRGVKPGPVPTVVVEHDGQVEELQTRLVVGADGRASLVRKWAGFVARRDPERLLVAGVLFEDMSVSQDTAYIIYNPRLGQAVPMFPQGGSRVRVYFVYPWDAGYRLQGARDSPARSRVCENRHARRVFRRRQSARAAATFSGADTWVEHPYRQGVALIGDAAAASDPSFGQGLALTVRDVRILRDALVTQEDWEVAGHTYATEHDRYYGVIHTLDNWVAELFLRTWTAAEARRARAVPLIVQDRSRMPDLYGVGPESRGRDSQTALFRRGVATRDTEHGSPPHRRPVAVRENLKGPGGAARGELAALCAGEGDTHDRQDSSPEPAWAHTARLFPKSHGGSQCGGRCRTAQRFPSGLGAAVAPQLTVVTSTIA